MKTKAFDGALRLLVRREHGAHELATKLQQKGHIALEIQEAIVACQQLGLQSDARFAENVCRARIRQGYGPVKIRHELQNLQVDRELVDSVLAKEQDNWLAHAIDVRNKKYKEQGEVPYAALQKQKQFLLYRGFSMDTITLVFRER